VLHDKSFYYKLRVEAALSLTKFKSTEKVHPIEIVYKYFKELYFDKNGSFVKPNDFSNISEYLIKKEIPIAISLIKEEIKNENITPPFEFLMEIIESNDDSENKYSGDFYKGSLIKSIGYVDHDNPEKQFKLISKKLVMDSLLPSYNQIISINCLNAICNMQCKLKVDLNLDLFWSYLLKREANFYIKEEAIRSILKISSLFEEKIVSKLKFENIFTKILDIVEDENYDYDMRMKTLILKFLTKFLKTNIENLFFQKSNSNNSIMNFLEFILNYNEENKFVIQKLINLLKSSKMKFLFQLKSDLMILYYTLFENNPALSKKKKFQKFVEEEEEIVNNPIVVEKKKKKTTTESSSSDLKRSLEPIKKIKKKKPKLEPIITNLEEKMETKQTPKIKIKLDSSGKILSTSNETFSMNYEDEIKKQEDNALNIEKEKERIENLKLLVNGQIQEHDEIRSKNLENGIGDRVIIIKIDDLNLYIRLYNNKTADSIYRSLPIMSSIVVDIKGILHFSCPGIEKIDVEENQYRILTKKHEVSYWVAGNEICLSIGSSGLVKGIQDYTYLYDNCNVFGTLIYTNKSISKLAGELNVMVYRPKRIILEYPIKSIKCEIDMYDNVAGYFYFKIQEILH
jgi:hypothetical protein